MHKPRGCIVVFNVHIRRVPLLLNVMAKDNPLKFNSTLPHAQRNACGLAQAESSRPIGDSGCGRVHRLAKWAETVCDFAREEKHTRQVRTYFF